MSPGGSRLAAALVVSLLALPALLPLATALGSWAAPTGAIWQHQLEHVLPRVTANTVLLLFAVATATAALGTALAWLVAGHDFPGRGFFAWALLLPLAMPGYVLAVVYAGALDYSGPLQTALRAAFGPGLDLPSIRSLGGAVLVLTLCLYPYVYMLARVAFETTGARTLEAAQSLGLGRGAAFRRLLLPLARPAIAAGVGLVAMETLADFGVVAALNVDTYTTAIYRAWYGLYSIGAALQMAGLLAALALAGLWIERRLRRGRDFAASRPGGGLLPRVRLRGVRAALATGAATAVLAVAFALPMAQLLAWAARSAATDLDARYWAFVGRSLALAGSGAAVVVGAALLLGYALRRDGRRWVHTLGRTATAGYAIPGTVLAVGLFAPIAAVNGWLQQAMDHWFGAAAPALFLHGTLLTMFVAYLARFLAVGSGPVESGLAGIHRHLDEASAILGVRGFARLRRVHFPLLRGSLLAAAVLVFVDLMKELPITLMTRPFGFETLAVRVFEMAAEGEWTRAALPSVMIVAAGIVPVVLLARRVTHVA
ncbi:MAG: iron ABC transporter permease [Lysobacterales bacterium]|nr:MAG: iron ABC transporter permease [Xanthomonadales bacterium]